MLITLLNFIRLAVEWAKCYICMFKVYGFDKYLQRFSNVIFGFKNCEPFLKLDKQRIYDASNMQ